MRMRLRISEAAKRGFQRVFLPSRRIYYTPDKNTWKNDGDALRNDWRVVGYDIREAANRYSPAQ